MSIPFVLEGQYKCLNCYARFYDDHGNPVRGWSWCPACGVKWEGALLFRHKKWHRFYDEHGIKEEKVPIRGWVLEKRWHGFGESVEMWEQESCSWEPRGRVEMLREYRIKSNDQHGQRQRGNCYCEYRLIRKTTYVWWSQYWSQIINGK